MEFPSFCASLENYDNWIGQQIEALEVPPASSEAIEISFQLAQEICQQIEQNQGTISFSDFMQTALYQPQLGYYSAGSRKFGQAGDFVTAPEISALFSRSLAAQFAQIFEQSQREFEPNLLEIGAGSGQLAVDILLELEERKVLPQAYFILEVSADLQQRQASYLQQKAPHLFERVTWLEQLPKDFEGIIFANEVLDAMPVELVRKQQLQLQRASVTYQKEGFCCQWQAQENWEDKFPQLIKYFDSWPEGYTTEVSPNIEPWVKSLTQCLKKGLMLFIDYGYPRTDFYQPQRSQGTLQCYYRQHKHFNPLLLLGLQDVTASVDFSLVAQAGLENNLELLGYSNQMLFLVGCGIEELILKEQDSATISTLKLGQELRALMMPDQMGESCKAIAFGKNTQAKLSCFSVQDERHKLAE